jgi:hypothetical protein
VPGEADSRPRSGRGKRPNGLRNSLRQRSRSMDCKLGKFGRKGQVKLILQLRLGSRAAQMIVAVPCGMLTGAIAGNGISSPLVPLAFSVSAVKGVSGAGMSHLEGVGRRHTIHCLYSDFVAIGEHLGCDVGLELCFCDHCAIVLVQHNFRDRERNCSRPGLREKARTPLLFSFSASADAKRMFAVLDCEYPSQGLYSAPFCMILLRVGSIRMYKIWGTTLKSQSSKRTPAAR